MLLVYLTINGSTHRVSNEMLILENPFLPKIVTFTSPKFNASGEHGGFCKISYGKVSFYPDTFEDSWPPPKSIEMQAYFSEVVEAGKQRIFDGTIFLTGVFDNRVEYNFFDIGSDLNLLDTIVSYSSGTDEVVIPKVFGDVNYFEALRLPNYSGYYNFHDAYLTSAFTVWDDGAGADITSNATKVAGSNSFYLNPNPVGTVTISGTSSIATTFSGLLTWVASEIGAVASFTSMNQTTEDKSVRLEITSQTKLIDFFDDILQYFCCLSFFRYAGDFLFTTDMDDYFSNSVYDHNEYTCFGTSISHNPPVDSVTINSIVRTAKTDPVDVVESESQIKVNSGYSYANNELSLDSQSFSSLTDQVDATKIIDVQGRPLISVTLPMAFPLTVPGMHFSITTTTDSYAKDMLLNVRAANITYNFDKEDMAIQGDGYYDYIGDKIWLIPQQSTTIGEIIPMLRVDPSNGNIAKHWLPGGSDATYIDYRNGCVDDDGRIWPAPYGNSDFCSFDTNKGLKHYITDLQGTASDFINTVNATGTGYVYFVPYSSTSIVKMPIGSVSGFTNILHSKSVTGGAYLCGAYANEYIWLAGGSHANITRLNTTTLAKTDYAHSKGVQAYSGGVTIGTNIWWCPKNSDYVTVQDATDGSFTHHLLSVYTTNDLFNGVVYDGTDLWFLPGSASSSIYKFSLTSFDVTTVHASGYANGTFNGGVYYDGFIWLSPESGDDIIKIDLSDGTVTAYAHGLSNSSSLYFIGAILTTE